VRDLDAMINDGVWCPPGMLVAVSSDGLSVHETGPNAWRGKFTGIPVVAD
jgi:hypothetical protein